jgi:tetratricopeptide (TPR) repeat protein
MKRRPEAAAYQSHALVAAARTEIESYCEFQELMAQAYLEAGDTEKAEAAVQLALEDARSSGTGLEQAEAERTAGRLYLLQEKHPEAIHSLRSALGHVLNAQHKMLELEIRALLALASLSTDPQAACDLLASVEVDARGLVLPEITAICRKVRNQLLAAGDDLFVISSSELPTIAEARDRLITWLFTHALQKAEGRSRKTAEVLGVTPTYVRMICRLLGKGLPPTRRSKTNEAKPES